MDWYEDVEGDKDDDEDDAVDDEDDVEDEKRGRWGERDLSWVPPLARSREQRTKEMRKMQSNQIKSARRRNIKRALKDEIFSDDFDRLMDLQIFQDVFHAKMK